MSCINSITVYPGSVRITKGQWYYDAFASVSSVCPECAEVRWYSLNSSIASVNATTGYIYGVNTGTTRIYAEATDGSGAKDYINVTVVEPTHVTGIEICPTSLTMNVGDTNCLSASVYPWFATNKTVTWCSSDDSVAEVNTYSGKVTAKKAGIVTITACTVDGGYSASCEVWVHGKTPVFLIHGRTSNSTDVWGINNNIPSSKNKHFDSDINANSLNGIKYIDVTSQEINGFDVNQGGTEKPVFLGNELKNAGYKENINLFVFNYPNQDAVVHSAKKFEKYIENLINYVRTSGTDEKKACFYASKSDYDNNNYKINIVGHSMGGLVARYYIENLGQDNHVDKLITICTPHWGSGYAEASNFTGFYHVLCDHDLDRNSAMFGGNNSANLNDGCTLWDITDIWQDCADSTYTLTDELEYQNECNTNYYFIAGITYNSDGLSDNNFHFELSSPNTLTNYSQLSNILQEKSCYRLYNTLESTMTLVNVPMDIFEAGDNLVGFLSQIGWTEDSDLNSPNKKIGANKIFVNIDTDGGNSLLDRFHSKMPCRQSVTNKVINYLQG